MSGLGRMEMLPVYLCANRLAVERDTPAVSAICGTPCFQLRLEPSCSRTPSMREPVGMGLRVKAQAETPASGSADPWLAAAKRQLLICRRSRTSGRLSDRRATPHPLAVCSAATSLSNGANPACVNYPVGAGNIFNVWIGRPSRRKHGSKGPWRQGGCRAGCVWMVTKSAGFGASGRQ